MVDRKDGIHLVLIFRGEQQDSEERFNFHWRDPRRIAEMSIISAAASKIITKNGYAGNNFDKSYIHLNANWSLSYAIPKSEHDQIMDKGSFGPGKWPEENVPAPNAHPHIQVIKEDDLNGHHELNLSFSGDIHRRNSKERQSDQKIKTLKNLLNQNLTPLVEALQNKSLI